MMKETVGMLSLKYSCEVINIYSKVIIVFYKALTLTLQWNVIIGIRMRLSLSNKAGIYKMKSERVLCSFLLSLLTKKYYGYVFSDSFLIRYLLGLKEEKRAMLYYNKMYYSIT